MSVSGAAGTEKTFLLNCIQKYAYSVLGTGNTIKTAAPSGTAAYLVGGHTLHSLLYLPIGVAAKDMKDLESTRKEDLERTFKEVLFLFIYEKSMVGQNLLYQVHKRLCEARPKRM